MILYSQKRRAEKFFQMNRSDNLLVLPNCWNPGSAAAYEKAGFQAVATSSAGIAYSLGYSDGEQVPFDYLNVIVQLISSKISVPLSVDFERGYGETGETVKTNAKRLIESGAVGFNLEDGTPEKKICPIEEMEEKILALSQLKKELALNFVLNVRTDIYWNHIGNEKERLKTAILKGNQFAELGADCIFIPGVASYEDIHRLVKEINCPLNILLSDQIKDLKRLETLGVKRVSLGSAPSRFILSKMLELADANKIGKFDAMFSEGVSYDKANEFFSAEEQEEPMRWGYQ